MPRCSAVLHASPFDTASPARRIKTATRDPFFVIRTIDLASRAQFWSAERAQAGARALEAQVALAGLPTRTLTRNEGGIRIRNAIWMWGAMKHPASP